MYLYVFSQDLHDRLVASGKQELQHMTDISGKPVWVFASDGKECFAAGDQYYRTDVLHMSF